MANSPLLTIKNLKKHFPVRKGLFSRVVNHVKAVDGISLSVWPGETVGLVGESGCGKTTAGRSILRLIEPTDGTIEFDGKDLLSLENKELRALRRQMQIIFQDPYSSLNPRMTVESLIGEGLRIHELLDSEREIRTKVEELLERVGLQASFIDRYPHEFSGGQRQRLGIARAIALNPKFIVCDESVSALDVSVQAQVINLLQDLQKELGLSYLFIAHDLSVVRHIADRVAVMYLGRLVEIGRTEEVFKNPAHPYTQALLSAIPVPDPTNTDKRITLRGDVPSALSPPAGCPFHPRCPAATKQCRTEVPHLVEIAAGRSISCHLYHEPARRELSLKQAQREVATLVKSQAISQTGATDPTDVVEEEVTHHQRVSSVLGAARHVTDDDSD